MCSSPESPTEYNFREKRPSDKGFRIYWTILNDGNSKYESKDMYTRYGYGENWSFVITNAESKK